MIHLGDHNVPNAFFFLDKYTQVRVYLTESVLRVVSQKSIPTQIRQLILCVSNRKKQVDRIFGGVAFCKTTLTTLCVRYGCWRHLFELVSQLNDFGVLVNGRLLQINQLLP